MKTEFLQNFKVGDQALPKEVIDAILAENGRDIENAKKPFADYEAVKDQLKKLESANGDIQAIQAELDKYKAAEEARSAREKAEAEKAALTERFKAVLGENKFASEFTEQGVFASFEKAINDPANVGKGDAELFAALTKDKEGIFQSAHPSVNMGGIKSMESGAPTSLAGARRERYEVKG